MQVQHQNDIKGFTLLEIMLVLFLIVIIFSFAMPRFNEFYHDLSVEEHAKQIVMVIRYASNQAVIHHKLYRVRFETGRARYYMEEQREYGDTEHYTLSPVVDTKYLTLGEDISFHEIRVQGHRMATGTVRCYPDGRIDPVEMVLEKDAKLYRIVMHSTFDQSAFEVL